MLKYLLVNNQTTIDVGTTSVLVSAQNISRQWLMVYNRGTAEVYLKFTSAHSGQEGISLPPRGLWEPLVAPYDAVYAVAKSGTQSLYICEGAYNVNF